MKRAFQSLVLGAYALVIVASVVVSELVGRKERRSRG